MKSTLTIGEAAAHFGLPAHVLRHWESVGLLAPARAVAARRRYTRADLYRIAAVVCAKQAGLPLTDIRTLLDARDLRTRREIFGRNVEKLRRRIAEAQAALAMLEGGESCTHENLATCPHFQSLLRPLVGD